MVACNCCFSCPAFHRQGRGRGRQVPKSTWKGSKKTARGQGGLWMPTQQVRGSSKSPSQPPTLLYARAGPFFSQLQRDHTLADHLEMEVGEGREPGGVFAVKIILSSLPLPESKVRPGVESPPPSLGAAAHARGQPGKRAPLMSSGWGPA